MKPRKVWIPVLALLAVAALLLVNFRLMRGQFNAEHQLFTSTFGREGPQEIAQNQDVTLYVQGANLFTRGMVGSLTRALEENVYIGSVTVREGPPQKSDGPVMAVRVDEASLFWAALYGQARVKLHVSYATNGAVDWMDDEVITGVPGPYTKYVSGDFSANDRAFGLISLPGYAAYLGEQFGARISEGLDGALKE